MALNRSTASSRQLPIAYGVTIQGIDITSAIYGCLHNIMSISGSPQMRIVRGLEQITLEGTWKIDGQRSISNNRSSTNAVIRYNKHPKTSSDKCRMHVTGPRFCPPRLSPQSTSRGSCEPNRDGSVRRQPALVSVGGNTSWGIYTYHVPAEVSFLILLESLQVVQDPCTSVLDVFL